MALKHAELQVSADADGDGQLEDAVFEMHDIEVTHSVRTGFLVGGRGSTVNNAIANLTSAGESNSKQFFLKGSGVRTVELSFRNWKGATGQWGNTGDSSKLTQTDATGADAISQLDVFFRYLTTGSIDSNNPATLSYGEYSDTGLYSPLEVVIESPNLTRSAEDGNWIDGSLTLIEAADIQQVYEAAARRLR
jgi:hypothetical protein